MEELIMLVEMADIRLATLAWHPSNDELIAVINSIISSFDALLSGE